MLKISEFVRILLHEVQLVFKGTLAGDKTVSIYALLYDFLVQEGVAAWSESWIGLNNHPDKCCELVWNLLLTSADEGRVFSSYHFLEELLHVL